MDLVEKKTVDFQFEDDRGSITQLVHFGYEQINVLISKERVVRGNHYHKQSTEMFYIISGSVFVTASYKGISKEFTFKEGDLFLIKPFVMHYMTFPEDCIMVQMYDKSIMLPDGSKDIYVE